MLTSQLVFPLVLALTLAWGGVPPASAQADATSWTPTVRLSDVTFVAMPTADQVHRAYPLQALSRATSATLVFLCRVQPEGDLGCTTPQVRQSDGATDLRVAFERAGQGLIPLYRVHAQLKSGLPSQDAVFGLALQFKVQE